MMEGHYKAGRYLRDGSWEYQEFDTYEGAVRFTEGYAVTSIVLNVAISGSGISAALEANLGIDQAVPGKDRTAIWPKDPIFSAEYIAEARKRFADNFDDLYQQRPVPTTAYDHGYEARKAGVPRNHSPPMRSLEALHDWLRGWDAADDLARRNGESRI
jgi:ribosome modulation factor